MTAVALRIWISRSGAWKGLAVALVLGTAAEAISETARHSGWAVSGITVALLLGLIVGNVRPGIVDEAARGLVIAKKQLLQLAVVLYGFRLTFSDIAAAGFPVLVIDALVLASTFAIALWLGTRWLKLDLPTAAMVGAGAAVCGNSAVLATAGILRVEPGRISVAAATVALFGTLAFLVYPLLYAANLHLGLIGGGAAGFGTYVGSTVHDVGQVVAAASASGPGVVDASVVAKMGRVAMMAPFLIAFAAWWARGHVHADGAAARKAPTPLFPLWFGVAVVLNSVLPLAALRPAIAWIDGWGLCIAMAALGLTTRLSAIRAAGSRPLLLGAALFAWLVCGGAMINVAVTETAVRLAR